MTEQTQTQRVTINNTKKVEVVKRFAEHNRRKREEHEQLAKTLSPS